MDVEDLGVRGAGGVVPSKGLAQNKVCSQDVRIGVEVKERAEGVAQLRRGEATPRSAPSRASTCRDCSGPASNPTSDAGDRRRPFHGDSLRQRATTLRASMVGDAVDSLVRLALVFAVAGGGILHACDGPNGLPPGFGSSVWGPSHHLLLVIPVDAERYEQVIDASVVAQDGDYSETLRNLSTYLRQRGFEV